VKPDYKFDRKNEGEDQVVEVALPACRTNKYIVAFQSEYCDI
jgi:hypothetical protein